MHSRNDVSKEVASVTAALNYLIPMDSTPILYRKRLEPPPGAPRHSGEVDVGQVPICDVRGFADRLEIERNGFRLLKHTMVRDFFDDDELCCVYDRDIERLVARITAASRVLVVDHVVRRATGSELAPKNTGGALVCNKEPFLHVHGDFMIRSAVQRVRELLRREAERLQSKRYIAVNVSRSVRGPEGEWPLALCDAQTSRCLDLVPCVVMYKERRSEICEVIFDAAHRWLYAPGMDDSEAWLFKTFDSSEQAAARRVPHSAFDDPTTDVHAPPRESLEVRAFGFYDT
jgi:hypothetical protein